MVRSFVHRGLVRFYRTGSKSGIQAKHANRLHLILWRLTFRFTSRNVEQVNYEDYH